MHTMLKKQITREICCTLIKNTKQQYLVHEISRGCDVDFSDGNTPWHVGITFCLF